MAEGERDWRKGVISKAFRRVDARGAEGRSEGNVLTRTRKTSVHTYLGPEVSASVDPGAEIRHE